MIITAQSLKNFKDDQEDRSLLRFLPNNEVLLGVFDGHGGRWVADYAERHFSVTFRAVQKKFPELTPEQTLHLVFARINQKVRQYYSGSTAAIAWLKLNENVVYVAILGDSQVFIKTPDGNIWESPEHNISSNNAELLAGLARGGRLKYGTTYLFDSYQIDGMGLQVGRALGDRDLDRILNREPEISRVEINKDSWILIGSDGLIDPEFNNPVDLKNFILKLTEDPKTTALSLVTAAAKLDNHDNSTAVLARLS